MRVDASRTAPSRSFDSDAFLDRAMPLGETEALYRQFRRNGNQYGPHFQTLAAAWQSDAENVARFSVTRDPSAATLLDAGVQLLGAFALTSGRTFLLKSIERLIVYRSRRRGPPVGARLPDRCRRRRRWPRRSVGSVEFLRRRWSLRLGDSPDVTLAFLDPPTSIGAIHETPLRVASTFTVEPLEDSLRFWGAHFGGTCGWNSPPTTRCSSSCSTPRARFARIATALI